MISEVTLQQSFSVTRSKDTVRVMRCYTDIARTHYSEKLLSNAEDSLSEMLIVPLYKDLAKKWTGNDDLLW